MARKGGGHIISAQSPAVTWLWCPLREVGSAKLAKGLSWGQRSHTSAEVAEQAPAWEHNPLGGSICIPLWLGCWDFLLLEGEVAWDQTRRGDPCPGQEHKLWSPVSRHDNKSSSGSHRAVAFYPCWIPAQHLPLLTLSINTLCLKSRIRAPFQTQSSCLPSLLSTWLFHMTCDLFQLPWSNLSRSAVPLLTPSAHCLVLCRFPCSIIGSAESFSFPILKKQSWLSTQKGLVQF